MKLLFVIPALHAGGAERQMTLLCNGMARRGHDVLLAYFYAHDPIFLADLDPLVRTKWLAKRYGKRANLKLFADLVRLLRSERVDAVQSFLAHANLLARSAGALCRTPALAGFRSRWAGGRLWLWTERALAPFTAAAVGNSHDIVEEAISRFGVRRMYYLPNIIDTRRFTYQERRIDGGVRFVMVARYVEEKNHRFALRLVEALGRRAVPVRLDCYGLIGDRRYHAELSREVQDSDLASWVRLHEAEADLPARLREHHFMIFPSRLREGTPNAVLESLASGLPVVLADHFRGESYAAHCLSVPIDDVAEGAKLVQDAIRSYDTPRARARRETARNYVESEHDMDAVCYRYEEILRTVVRE